MMDMKTRITELFDIKYPIVLSGMTGVSLPRLVAAVSNAGGLGILATGDLDVDQTRNAVHEIRKLTDKPFGANVPLFLPGAESKAAVLLDEKVDVINYAIGKGDWLTQAAHEYGGKVIATVVNHKHALSAQRGGADALIVTGHEAAAHGGAVTSLVLIPSLVDAVDIPVIAAGGFADGRGLIAALALGAEGIAMGTRFMNTVESPAHPNMKKSSIEKGVYDTVYSERIDGLPCRVLKSRGTERLIKNRCYLLTALLRSKKAARALGAPWIKLVLSILASGYRKSMQMARMANVFPAFERGIQKGDQDKGVFIVGQVTGIIHHTPTVAEIVDKIVAEAQEVQETMAVKLSSSSISQNPEAMRL